MTICYPCKTKIYKKSIYIDIILKDAYVYHAYTYVLYSDTILRHLTNEYVAKYN